jgi:translation initiation factor IF-3
MSKGDALKAANEHELDLVEISPNASPPVVKVINWGKYQYQQAKQQKRNQKNAKASELKQMRFGLKIGKGDLDIKVRKIRSFLEDGNKVRVSAFFRGREMAHKDLGYKLLDEVTKELEDIAVVEQPPQMAGRNLSIVLRSKSNAKAKDPQRNS